MRIIKENTQAIVIDIQDKFYPHLFEKDVFIRNVKKLIEGLKVLQIPTIVTEQYPEGLGSTMEEVYYLTKDFLYFEKKCFSCLDSDHVKKIIEKTDKKNIILLGIETHVCVLQTSLDCLEKGFVPIVVEDCVTSRKEKDKKTALDRMRHEGVIITSLESLLLELKRVAGDDQFKQLSKIIK